MTLTKPVYHFPIYYNAVQRKEPVWTKRLTGILMALKTVSGKRPALPFDRALVRPAGEALGARNGLPRQF